MGQQQLHVLAGGVDTTWLPCALTCRAVRSEWGVSPDVAALATGTTNHSTSTIGVGALARWWTNDHWGPAAADWVPDIVHGHDWRVGWAADTLARHHGVPFILTMHGTERVRHGGNLSRSTGI